MADDEYDGADNRKYVSLVSVQTTALGGQLMRIFRAGRDTVGTMRIS
jgi:hypothetical protein